MTRISEEAKQAIVKKVLSNNGQMISEIALANKIGRSTLWKWVKRFKLENHIAANLPQTLSNGKVTSNVTITPLDRLKHLQATFGQDSVMVGAYCRQHGLYPHQLTEWENDFMTGNHQQKQSTQSNELKELRAEIKTLKHIIVRKDKVLAETVVLLVLKKKAAHIWGEGEED